MASALLPLLLSTSAYFTREGLRAFPSPDLGCWPTPADPL